MRLRKGGGEGVSGSRTVPTCQPSVTHFTILGRIEINMINFLDFSQQYDQISEEIESKVLKILRSTKYTLGEEVTAFEESLSLYCNTKYAVGLANGTDALVLALKAIGISTGDEVITTPFTFFATAEAISLVNAKPVFVDIDEKNLCLNPSLIEEKITNKTRAIIPVHIFGQIANMNEIMSIAQKYNLYVIEDACQAIGSLYDNKKAGSIGDIGCFSFYPTKNLGCAGDGGAIVTNNEELTQQIRLLRVHGSKKKYHHELIGYNSRLDEIQAGILNVKIKYIDYWNNKRREIAERYNLAFSPIKNLHLPLESGNKKHIYHLYSIRVPGRDSFKSYLDNNGIGNGIYYPIPLHKQPPYEYYNNTNKFPVAEKITKEILSLPIYPELTEEHQTRIIECVLNYFN